MLDVGSTKQTSIVLCHKCVELWLCTAVGLCAYQVDLLPLQCIRDAPILLSFPRKLLFLFSSATNFYLNFRAPFCGSCKEAASQATLMSQEQALPRSAVSELDTRTSDTQPCSGTLGETCSTDHIYFNLLFPAVFPLNTTADLLWE